ncbi:MAG: dTDP-4-dehydrorhamnose reductase [Culturomica sp.]|jgi:dTDP-4-dehydrorhamnose reductase|nr:dTDP-4-dehydrorhamnose reductase [Culturomica sp.]
MANILVTGANGQLGSELRKIGFTALDEIFYTDVVELDITDSEAVEKFVLTNDIDTIVNCAAYTAVDRAEDEPELARAVNTRAAEVLAQVAYNNDCLLIHVSTDYVFDGTATEPYNEKSATNPQSVYGATKLAGEQAIRKSGCMYIVIRTAWLYSSFGNNFVKTIRRIAREKGILNVVDDQTGTPTYAADLAQFIVDIIHNSEILDHEGIYHYSNEGVCTWFDFAKEIVNLSGIECVVNPVSTTEYPTKAKRPKYSVLDKSKVKKIFGTQIEVWQDALRRCIKELDK